MPHATLRMQSCILIATTMTATIAADVAAGDCVEVLWDVPAADRWNYPFNITPGDKPDAKIFGAYEETGLSADFDNRDGQMVIGFDTADQVPVGLPLDAYDVLGLTVTLMVESEDAFQYDPTLDGWASYLLKNDPLFEADDDPGRPVELFGVGFRDGLTALSWQENSPYSATSATGKFVRTAWPLAFDGSGEAFDVSNTVDDQVDPVPFAIGLAAALSPGDIVPQLTTMSFQINTDDPEVLQYLRASLQEGRILFSIASVFPAAQQVGGSFPEFFTKENVAVEFDLADAATLSLRAHIGRRGDVDDSGSVNVDDLLAVLAAWGACTGTPCNEDTNCDDVIDVNDLLNVLADWG